MAASRSSANGPASVAILVLILSLGVHGGARAGDSGAAAAPGADAKRPSAAEAPSSKKVPGAPELERNGFDLREAAVPPAEIIEGGPPRDGIHSVDAPRFVAPGKATWAPPPVPVIGVALEGEARAYPVHLLEYHQVVNDRFGSVPVVVTYDPLTGVPKAYRSRVDGRDLHFGVSGLIYKASFLLYDRETESLWSQYLGKAISGPLSGRVLEAIQVRQEPMGIWFRRHLQTTVLTRPEPKKIDYRYSPFKAYWISDKVIFPVDAVDDRYHPKEVVLGVSLGNVHRAYLGSILTAAGGRIVDDFEGRKIRVEYDSETSTFIWEAPKDVVVTDAYWFAWKSFHPDTEIWGDRAPSPE